MRLKKEAARAKAAADPFTAPGSARATLTAHRNKVKKDKSDKNKEYKEATAAYFHGTNAHFRHTTIEGHGVGKVAPAPAVGFSLVATNAQLEQRFGNKEGFVGIKRAEFPGSESGYLLKISPNLGAGPIANLQNNKLRISTSSCRIPSQVFNSSYGYVQYDPLGRRANTFRVYCDGQTVKLSITVLGALLRPIQRVPIPICRRGHHHDDDAFFRT